MPDTPDTPALPPVEGLAGRTVSDPRVRRYVLPTRIVWHSSQAGAVVTTPERLLLSTSGQVTLGSPPACVLRHEGHAPGILLDFGRELQGGVQIGVSELEAVGANDKTVRMRVRFGESASEAMSELGQQGSQSDHAVRDQTLQVPWLGTVDVGSTGFRFVRLDLLEPGASVTLAFVRAIFVYRDLPYIGSFRCSDPRLDVIWRTAAYTTHLNMQDYLWDGIKRDRLVWVGDMHPEAMTIGAVWGNVSIVPRSLDLIRDATPLPGWMNGISSYSLWWILIQRDWYSHTGDTVYLQQQGLYLIALLTELQKYIDADGRETLPEGRFLDWPSSDNKPAVHAGLHALLLLAFKAGAELCQVLFLLTCREGEERAPQYRDMTVECMRSEQRMKQYVPDPNHSKQAAALMALAELSDPVSLNQNVLGVGGAKNLSTFYGYYVLEARAKAGDYQGCLDTIRQYWGGMLDVGATTFWEDFDLDWTQNAGRIDEITPPGKRDIHGDFGAYCYGGFRHSLCHGWASGPAPWLTRHVLGVDIAEAGCKTLRVTPHLGDLQWAEGTFPTPCGVVTIRHDKQADESVTSVIDAPPGVEIVR